MNFVLVLVFFLCLMFLTMIFGERLSLFGFLDGRWFTAPFDMAATLWDMVCELADRLATFVQDHFWWVTATVSGSVGIALIALIMVSGLSDEAHAIRSAERSPLLAGGVLDQVPVLETTPVLQTRVAVADDDSHLVYQQPSGFAATFPRLPPPREEIDFAPLPRERRMPLPRPMPDFNRGRLQISLNPFVIRHGHPVRSERLDRMIRQTVLSLRNDPWETFSDVEAARRFADSEAIPMREDSEYAVADLYERVRVIPGDQVSSRSLEVEKQVPENTYGNFEIRVRITNRDRGRIDGLIVREHLPHTWEPVGAEPLGVFRDSVVTWLVDGIESFEERVLTLQVRSTEAGHFQPVTEISATAAVSSFAAVADRPVPEREQSLPPVTRRPDVRVALARPPTDVTVDDWVDVVFAITNVGDAPAEGVKLRVNLPRELDHHDLTSADIDRWVDSKIRRLDPQERRLMKLTVQPTVRGRHTAIAQLLFQGAQLDKRKFDVVGVATADDVTDEVPLPDFR